MVEHVTKQEGVEWHAYRRGPLKLRVGGSEVGAALGVSEYATPKSLWEYIHWQRQGYREHNGVRYELHQNESEEMTHGTVNEPRTIRLYEMLTSQVAAPGNYWECVSPSERWPRDGDHLYYGCSPDGVVSDTLLLECKAPFHRAASKIAPHYMAQMQYQMAVTGRTQCDFVSVFYRPKEQETWWHDTSCPWNIKDPERGDVFIRRVHFSNSYWAWMYAGLQRFTREYLIPRAQPPLLERLIDPLRDVPGVEVRVDAPESFIVDYHAKMRALRIAAHTNDLRRLAELCPTA